MAAEWYYTLNQQQAGPVELDALRQMFQRSELSPADLVFGPGLAQWTAAGQVPGLIPSGFAGGANPLAYHGTMTDPCNLSTHAMSLLRQTKPWARFLSIMMFISVGFMMLGGVAVGLTWLVASSRYGSGMPGFIAPLYIAMALLYIAPAVYLHRFASGLSSLMRSNRMHDLEIALAGQKSFWKFTGIMVIIVIAIYIIAIPIAIISSLR